MSSELIKSMATRINAVTDWPFLNEAQEQFVDEFLLELALSFLPPQYLTWLLNAADGIDDHEAADLTAWLSGLMSAHSKYPKFACDMVSGVVVSLLRKGSELVHDVPTPAPAA